MSQAQPQELGAVARLRRREHITPGQHIAGERCGGERVSRCQTHLQGLRAGNVYLLIVQGSGQHSILGHHMQTAARPPYTFDLAHNQPC